jgi:hypothetical protein
MGFHIILCIIRLRQANSRSAGQEISYTSATVWPIVPGLDDDECGEVGEMRIGRGN